MAKRNGYSRETREDSNTGQRRRWWKAKAEDVARELIVYCASLESAQQRDRYLGMIFEQLATGRAAISYGTLMEGRVKGDMATALFAPPSENYVAIAVDVFANKIGKNHPFLQWIPLADSDTDVRTACRQATDYTDQIFEDLKTWPMKEQAAKDATIHGGGYILVDGIHGEKGKPGKVILERIQDDEILLDPTAGENPPNFQIRRFTHRDIAIRKYAVGPRADEIREALEKAPGCEQGFYQIDEGYKDTLALCLGFYIPGDGSPGRKVTAIQGYAKSLEDVPFTGDLPIAKFIFEPVAGQYKGQGAPEQMLPLQREVDRIADNLAEGERRFCWAKWGVRRQDQIDPDQLIGSGTVETSGQMPEALDSPEPPQTLYDQLEKKGQQCLLRVGISNNQAQGMAPPGADSGVAKMAAQQIDDVRHVAVGQRDEQGVEMLGKLIIQAAAIYKPAVYSSGRLLEWPQIANDQKLVKCRAFPMSGLPQAIPGRKQELYNMRQSGEIDQITYRRALGLSETRPVQDAITVNQDFVQFQLDEMILTGEFLTPPVWIDFEYALSAAQARLMTETMKKLKQKDRLQLIAQYQAMCAERLEENPTPELPPQTVT